MIYYNLATYALDGETYFRNICSGLPSFWRFLQCLRKAKDTKKKKELANARILIVDFYNHLDYNILFHFFN